MRFPLRTFIAVAVVLISMPVSAAPISDDQVRSAIIRESLAGYPGNCPCPYNSDRAGRSCGRRSAYSRPGGYSPICYPDQVAPDMIRQYRDTHR
jgi:hypothetical protein